MYIVAAFYFIPEFPLATSSSMEHGLLHNLCTAGQQYIHLTGGPSTSISRKFCGRHCELWPNLCSTPADCPRADPGPTITLQDFCPTEPPTEPPYSLTPSLWRLPSVESTARSTLPSLRTNWLAPSFSGLGNALIPILCSFCRTKHLQHASSPIKAQFSCSLAITL
ncbi:uncharacterized protein LOC144130113 [Amblyomma americanum]